MGRKHLSIRSLLSVHRTEVSLKLFLPTHLYALWGCSLTQGSPAVRLQKYISSWRIGGQIYKFSDSVKEILMYHPHGFLMVKAVSKWRTGFSFFVNVYVLRFALSSSLFQDRFIPDFFHNDKPSMKLIANINGPALTLIWDPNDGGVWCTSHLKFIIS